MPTLSIAVSEELEPTLSGCSSSSAGTVSSGRSIRTELSLWTVDISSSAVATIMRDATRVSSTDSPDAKRGSSDWWDTTGGHGFGRLQIGRIPFARIRKSF